MFMSFFFLLILMIFTIITTYFFWREMLSPSLFPDVRETLNENMLSKWWTNYTHPLVVSSQTIRPNKGKDSKN